MYSCATWLSVKCAAKNNTASVINDIPIKVIKRVSEYLLDPLTHIINSQITRGEFPKIWKVEQVTLVPKTYPTSHITQLRKISLIRNFGKISEKVLAEMVIEDLSKSLDKCQYGNQKGVSINHYLVNLIHKVLYVLDKNGNNEAYAVIMNLYDWKSAFDMQCPKLGLISFMKNGVRPSLLPVLKNFLQDRTMKVKWHGKVSSERPLNGGGPQGTTFGIWEYLSQSNGNLDFLDEDQKYKFLDDA